MYGSTKPDCEVYNIIKTYHYNNNIIQEIEHIQKDTLFYVKEFSIINKFDKTPINKEMKNKIQEYKEKQLKNKNEIVNIVIDNTIKSDNNNDNNIDLVKDLVDILKFERADDYNSGIKIGRRFLWIPAFAGTTVGGMRLNIE